METYNTWKESQEHIRTIEDFYNTDIEDDDYLDAEGYIYNFYEDEMTEEEMKDYLTEDINPWDNPYDYWRE